MFLASLEHQEPLFQNSSPPLFFLFYDLTIFDNFMCHQHLILHLQTALPQEREFTHVEIMRNITFMLGHII